MTVYTADDRAIFTCDCVHRRLREVDRLLAEARVHGRILPTPAERLSSSGSPGRSGRPHTRKHGPGCGR